MQISRRLRQLNKKTDKMQKERKVKKPYPKSPQPQGAAPINNKSGKGFPFVLIPVILAIILYCNTIPNDYCLDDFLVIKDNTYVNAGLRDIPEILTTNFFNGVRHFNDGLYRPIPILTYAVEYSLIGLDPHVRHFINMILYALVGYFIFLLMKRLLPGSHLFLPLSISILFIAHPIHTEVVANIKGRDDLLAFLFSVMAMYYIVRYFSENKKVLLISGLSSYLVALLSKESSVMFLFIIPLMLILFKKVYGKRLLSVVLPLLLITIIWLLWRTHVINSMSIPVDKGIFSSFNNSILSTNNMFSRVATGLYLQILYISKLIIPVFLSHDYSFNQIPVIPAVSIKSILSLLVVSGLFLIAILQIRKRKMISFGIFYYFFTIAIVANIFIYIGVTFAERLLFTPSFGFAIIEGALLYKLTIKGVTKNQNFKSFITGNKLYMLIFLIILCLYSVKTISRNSDWKNNFTLFSADVSHSPNSARTHYNLGTELFNWSVKQTSEEKRKEYLNKAVVELKKAVNISPGYLDAMNNLGSTYQNLDMLDSAIAVYRKVVEIDSNYHKSDLELGICYYKTGQFREAIPCLQSVLRYHGDNETAYLLIGSSYGSLGDFTTAIRYLEKSLALNGKNTDALILLGKGYGIKGEFTKSAEIFNRIIQIDPSNLEAYHNLGITYLIMKQPEKSIGYFLKCLQLKPDYLQVYDELIRSYETIGDKDKVAFYKQKLAGMRTTGK